jgi:hypothetical protein
LPPVRSNRSSGMGYTARFYVETGNSGKSKVGAEYLPSFRH